MTAGEVTVRADLPTDSLYFPVELLHELSVDDVAAFRREWLEARKQLRWQRE